ncbi:MAG: C4-dicarboxylate TRAP transporter substrate-binding protein [Spirochaetaceae bacterium]|jgi:TRAP-type C4-dicarboxylate transport system substrate-binding protein|nr:C4-dicarboxylate TRAP transporter substrate-binding protein [Spirochaetaceae bacterium]
MKKFFVSAVVITVCFLSACGKSGGASSSAGSSSSGEKKKSYTLRFGHALTDKDIYNVYMEKWAEDVKQASDGGLIIEIYPSSQLGSEEDVLDQIRQGANIGWQTDFARLGTYVKGLSVVNAPFFVDNLEEAMKLQTSETIKKLNDELATKFGIAHISFGWVQGQRHVFANTIAKNPAEMQGLLIRTAPAPIWVESVNALGCTATPLPYGDIYTGIQTKVVDGCELPYNAANNIKLAEVTKYVMETGHIFQLNAMVVSKAWLDKLPAEYQKILMEACNKAGAEASQALAEQTAASRQAMIQGGVQVIERSELDIPGFVKNSASAYAALGLSDVRAQVYADIGKQ